MVRTTIRSSVAPGLPSSRGASSGRPLEHQVQPQPILPLPWEQAISVDEPATDRPLLTKMLACVLGWRVADA